MFQTTDLLKFQSKTLQCAEIFCLKNHSRISIAVAGKTFGTTHCFRFVSSKISRYPLDWLSFQWSKASVDRMCLCSYPSQLPVPQDIECIDFRSPCCLLLAISSASLFHASIETSTFTAPPTFQFTLCSPNVPNWNQLMEVNAKAFLIESVRLQIDGSKH